MSRGLGDVYKRQALASSVWIAPGALVIWEENAPQDAPEGYAKMDSRRYGDTNITILEALE